MALSARSRKKRSADAERLFEPGTTVHRYANAVAGPYPTNTILLIILAAVGITVVLSLLVGNLVGPGVLVGVLVYWAFNPPRAIAVSDRGVALLRRSMWTGKPTHVMGLLPHEVLNTPHERGGYVQVQVGPEAVWLSKREWDALAST
jgi:hypothetical protein